MEKYPTVKEINGIQKLLDELTSIQETLNNKTPLSETDELLLKITNCLYEIVDNLDDRVNDCEYDLNTLKNYGHF